MTNGSNSSILLLLLWRAKEKHEEKIPTIQIILKHVYRFTKTVLLNPPHAYKWGTLYGQQKKDLAVYACSSNSQNFTITLDDLCPKPDEIL